VLDRPAPSRENNRRDIESQLKAEGLLEEVYLDFPGEEPIFDVGEGAARVSGRVDIEDEGSID